MQQVGSKGGSSPECTERFISHHDGRLDVAEVLPTGVGTFLNAPRVAPALSVVSAAGFTPGSITAGSIASAFGRNFPVNPAFTITDTRRPRSTYRPVRRTSSYSAQGFAMRRR